MALIPTHYYNPPIAPPIATPPVSRPVLVAVYYYNRPNPEERGSGR
jgi:hypothetical protein